MHVALVPNPIRNDVDGAPAMEMRRGVLLHTQKNKAIHGEHIKGVRTERTSFSSWYFFLCSSASRFFLSSLYDGTHTYVRTALGGTLDAVKASDGKIGWYIKIMWMNFRFGDFFLFRFASFFIRFHHVLPCSAQPRPISSNIIINNKNGSKYRSQIGGTERFIFFQYDIKTNIG